MQLRPQSIQTLTSQFRDLTLGTYDSNTTLSISTALYNAGAFKAGLPPVGTFPWVYQSVAGLQTLQGLFICTIPAWALGPGPNSPGNVFPLTLVTVGIASDNVTVRFTDVIQAFPRVDTN